jgi:LPXTG-motif cell wall-anchored protein
MTWLRRCLELPWVEMIAAVCCFHFALADPRIIYQIIYALVGIALLATAILSIVKRRKSTHYP